jgi:hypothetical protein
MILTGIAVLLLVPAASSRSAAGSVRALGRTHDSARRRLVSVLWTFAARPRRARRASRSTTTSCRRSAPARRLVVVGLGYAVVPSAVGQFGAWAASIGLCAA